jgi:hypothetical protein
MLIMLWVYNISNRNDISARPFNTRIESRHFILMDLFDSYSHLVTVRPVLPEIKIKGYMYILPQTAQQAANLMNLLLTGLMV